jgi:hypothetical protein
MLVDVGERLAELHDHWTHDEVFHHAHRPGQHDARR